MWSLYGGDRFFEELAAEVDARNDGESLRAIHQSVRQRWQAAGVFLHWASDVMVSVEEMNDAVREEEPTTKQAGEKFPMYSVTTEDLGRLIGACNDVGDLGHGSLQTVEHKAFMVSRVRSKGDKPASFDEIKALVGPLLLSDMRYAAKRDLQRSQEAEKSHGPEEMASGQEEITDGGLESERQAEVQPEREPAREPERQAEPERQREPEPAAQAEQDVEAQAENDAQKQGSIEDVGHEDVGSGEADLEPSPIARVFLPRPGILQRVAPGQRLDVVLADMRMFGSVDRSSHEPPYNVALPYFYDAVRGPVNTDSIDVRATSDVLYNVYNRR